MAKIEASDVPLAAEFRQKWLMTHDQLERYRSSSDSRRFMPWAELWRRSPKPTSALGLEGQKGQTERRTAD